MNLFEILYNYYTMSTINNAIREWTAIATYHREGLVKAEKHLKDLQSVEVLLTETELKKRVLAMAPTDRLWKKAVDEDLIYNVCHILDVCYYSFLTDFPTRTKTLERIGTRKSLKWQLFKLDVIKRLKTQGSFGLCPGEEYDTFYDTAGGCDEVACKAAMDLLEEPVTA